MASEKYKLVLQNEKFMNDAVLSAFSNLHKAARKKSDYIWSTTKFNSLNSIWGDFIEPDTNKMQEDSHDVGRNSKGSCTVNRSNSNSNTAEMHESGYETYTEELSSKTNWKVHTGNGKSAQKVFGTVDDVSNNEVKYKHLHRNYPNICNKSNQDISGYSESVSSNRNILKESCITRQSHLAVYEKSKDHTYKNYNDGISKEINKSEPMTGCYKEEAEEWYRQQDMIKFPLHRNVRSRRSSLNTSNENTSSEDDAIQQTPSSFKSKHHQRASKSQLKITESGQSERKMLRSKRTRHNSDSSTNSNKPHQKRFSGRTENVKSPENNVFREMLSVKITGDDLFHEYTVNLPDFNRVKRKFPELSNVLPDADGGEKEVEYCGETMKAILGSLFNPPYNFNLIPEGRPRVEVLAAARSCGIQHFYDKFQNHFLRKITESNFITVYYFASHFGLQEICDACAVFDPRGEFLNSKKPYRSRKCSVTVSRYIEPLEYCIPLENAGQMLKNDDFYNIFDRDIRNTVVFEAITKDFNVVGFGIFLDTGGDKNTVSPTLDIFYSVKILNNNEENEEMKLSKPLRSIIAIYFRRKILVRKGQKLQISVETTLKPYFCFATSDSYIKDPNGAEFSLTLESTYKVKDSRSKRFMIGKLLYNSIDLANSSESHNG